MAGYTIKNVRECEDHAPRFGFDAVQEARFPYRELGAEQVGMAFHIVKAGQRQAFAHRHHEAEEIYVVLSGTGRIKLDDDIVDVKPLDAIRIGPGVGRALEADAGAPLEFLAFGAHHEGESEMIKNDDFWGDGA
jgi:mannose-6-phosphate isomerase-like protein (cupin superfamily)